LEVTARRHANGWVVCIQDASNATLGQRSAQFSLIGESLRPTSSELESFAGKRAHRLDVVRLRKLDELVEFGLAEFGVPGAAVAIVQGDRVVHARGYGVRQLGRGVPVDADTLFPIASNTKALTTLLLAQLVDEGKLLFDAESEVVEDLRTAARTLRESVAKERSRLAVPADAQPVAGLAARYEHPSLGAIDVKRSVAATRFDFGEWASDVASRSNDDGTVSFVAISPGIGGFNFVVGQAGGKRTLTLRDAQSEYVFVEAG
jgi:hypothetical protein